MSLAKQKDYKEAIQQICKITRMKINKELYTNENDCVLLWDSNEIKTSSPRNNDCKNNKRRNKNEFNASSESICLTSQSLQSLSDKYKDGPPREYEEVIIKLEGDIRMHIRVEQQMRLHIENLQQKIEDLERENDRNVKGYKLEIDELKCEK